MTFADHLRRLIERFYFKPLHKILPLITFRYAVCGVLNYIVLDTLLYALLYNCVFYDRYIDLGFVMMSPHVAALVVVFPITLLTGFWLNRFVAFDSTQSRVRTQLFKYILSIAGSLLLNYLLLKLFVEVVGLWPTPSKLLTTLLTTCYSYLAARFFTFQR